MHLSIPLLFSMLLSLMPAGMTTGDTHFLDREVIVVPTIGVTKVTSASLEPYAVYRVQFSSPRDLADIAQGHVDVCLNSSPAKILDFETGLFDSVIRIHSLYQGTGDPLTIQLKPSPTFGPSRLEKFAQRIPTIEVTITRLPWWQYHRGLGIRPEVIQAASVFLGLAILVYIRYRYGRDAWNRFITHVTRGLQGGMGFPPLHGGRRAPGRVRVVRDHNRDDGGVA